MVTFAVFVDSLPLILRITGLEDWFYGMLPALQAEIDGYFCLQWRFPPSFSMSGSFDEPQRMVTFTVFMDFLPLMLAWQVQRTSNMVCRRCRGNA